MVDTGWDWSVYSRGCATDTTSGMSVSILDSLNVVSHNMQNSFYIIVAYILCISTCQNAAILILLVINSTRLPILFDQYKIL